MGAQALACPSTGGCEPCQLEEAGWSGDRGIGSQSQRGAPVLASKARTEPTGAATRALSAIADPTTTDEVRADHDRAVAEFGAFGVPVLVFPDGQGLFGPTVVPAPTGDEAERLWEWVLGYREFPSLYEVKRPKTGDDLALIADVFEPYLRARSWRTIENPAP